MGFLITTSQSHLLGLSLGLAVLVFGVFQICEGLHIILYRWNSASIIAQYMIRIIAVINIVDGLTGVGAALLPSPSLAFTAAIGYIVDGLVHITQTTLRWVAVFEEYEAGLLPNKGSTWTFINLLWVLMSILVLALTWMFVRATFSYYQVLLVGGSGWEYMSPQELLEEKFGVHELEDLRRGATIAEREGILEAGVDTGGEEILQQKVYI